MPIILLTNDDGIFAPGLRALRAAMEGLGDVYVAAPDRERSAAAQSITLLDPVFYEQVAEREWAVAGTPTDAVILALNRLLPGRPDLVLSGINHGGNLGENVYYSGTAAAAMEGTINGLAACAISMVGRYKEPDFSKAAAFSRQLAELALAEGLPEGVMLNVNVPGEWRDGVRFTRQSKKITRNLLQEGVDPRGRKFVWLSEQKRISDVEPDTDYEAVFAGSVSITPLSLDRTHTSSLNHLSHWAEKLRG
ncbi:MAG TPA: 5'/3'-nucleotidase SurE [Candidatus Acidoferrales bacterium]|nr:5'/3'-nucleotidase SurE [Candidatus Acidoferrales bacterium]